MRALFKLRRAALVDDLRAGHAAGEDVTVEGPSGRRLDLLVCRAKQRSALSWTLPRALNVTVPTVIAGRTGETCKNKFRKTVDF